MLNFLKNYLTKLIRKRLMTVCLFLHQIKVVLNLPDFKISLFSETKKKGFYIDNTLVFTSRNQKISENH